MRTVSLALTWGEWGNIFCLLVRDGERKALETLRPDLARAFAFAEAFSQIKSSLTEEQAKQADVVIKEEMRKQGISTSQHEDS